MGEPPVEQIARIGMDRSEKVFSYTGVNSAEKPVLRKKLTRQEIVRFSEKLPPTVVAIETCGSAPLYLRGSVSHAEGGDWTQNALTNCGFTQTKF